MIRGYLPLGTTLLFSVFLQSCAELKDTGRTIGHGARDVGTAIGHASRDAAKSIGKNTKKIAEDISDESEGEK